MEKKRKVYAPFSLTSEAGVGQTPVEGYIDVNQVIYPTVNTGTVNENGKWTGVKSDDEEFIGLTKAVSVAASTAVLFPDSNNHPSIDMTGFNDLQIAIKSTSTDSVKLEAFFGPDTVPFANLSPIAAGQFPKILTLSRVVDDNFDNILLDTSEATVGNAWIVFTILGRCKGQKNLQIKVTNLAGHTVDSIEFAFRRLV